MRLFSHLETSAERQRKSIFAGHGSGDLNELQGLHVRPCDVRGLRPVAAERHRHAPLRIAAGRIVVAANLLARRHIERIVEGERRHPGVLRDPEAVQRREQRRAQAFAEPESPA
jgi:hypothetical protein